MRYPIIPPFTGLEPITRVTPFTERAGSTYLKILEELAEYVSKLAKNVNGANAELLSQVEQALNDNIAKTQEALKEAVDIVDAEIQRLQTVVSDAVADIHTALEATVEGVGVTVAELRDYVNAKVQEIIDGSVTITDQAVSEAVGNPSSETRAALEALFGDASTRVISVAGRVGDVVLTPDDIGATSTPDEGTVPIRGNGGVLGGVGRPNLPTDAGNKSYVDGAVSPVSAQLDAMQSVMATQDDLIFSTIISGTGVNGNVATDAPHSHYVPIAVAPFKLRIVSAWMGIYGNQTTPTATNYPVFALRRFRNDGGKQIVGVVANHENPPKVQEGFSLDGGTWSEVYRILNSGDMLAFGVSIGGTYTFKYPISVTVKYERVYE